MGVHYRDRFAPAFGGFVEVTLAGGWQGLIKAEDVQNVLPRNEGGSAIHVRNLRTLLVDLPVARVIAVLREASKSSGGSHETA